jgi:predicted DNA binding CopG/RHH family protein
MKTPQSKKTNEKFFKPLDDEERELMDEIENDAFQPATDARARMKKAMAAARNTLNKDKRINLRITPKEYHQIRIRALEEGIPYQTLIASILHKYLNGTLVSRH